MCVGAEINSLQRRLKQWQQLHEKKGWQQPGGSSSRGDKHCWQQHGARKNFFTSHCRVSEQIGTAACAPQTGRPATRRLLPPPTTPARCRQPAERNKRGVTTAGQARDNMRRIHPRM